MSIDWSDHLFILVLGPPVDKIRTRNLKECPYKETHKGETGVVFFPDLETAKRYMASRRLNHHNVAGLPDPELVVRASVEMWGCDVAFLIRQEGKGFRRDVTEFTSFPPPSEN